MDIPSLSVAYSQAKVMNMAGAAVLSMALDSTKQQNATLLEMMGASANVPQVSTQRWNSPSTQISGQISISAFKSQTKELLQCNSPFVSITPRSIPSSPAGLPLLQ